MFQYFLIGGVEISPLESIKRGSSREIICEHISDIAYSKKRLKSAFAEMSKQKDGDRWVIDGSVLTLYDVKKGLHGNGDNAVYQCKAENKHGYIWANFYLNLLGKFLVSKTHIRVRIAFGKVELITLLVCTSGYPFCVEKS